jgi:hypothetical protein
MPFDPNAFLQKYGTPAEGEPTSTGFDPNAFLKKYGSDNAAPATTGFDPNSFLKKYGVEQPTPVDTTSQKPPEPRPEDQSFLRSVADVPLNITQGGATGIRMIADAFGADSSTSKTLRGVEDYLGSLMSAQSKQDKQEISRIMKEAEDKGVGDQVLAGLKALSIAPVDTISNALGTSAPAIIGGLGALFFGAPAAVVTGTAVGIGSVMGAGTIKSAVYDATKEELTKLKLPPDEVERRAEAAQAYSGKNLDQIAIGSALGGLSAFGFETATLKNIASNIVGRVAAKEAAKETAETAVEKGVVRRVGENVVKEAVPEGAQGSQEQLAQNLALQREGIDTPTMRGVISQGVLEAGASAPLGAYAGLREKQPTADTTGAGDALRRLDELAAREEAGTTGEVTVPPSPPPSTPSTQSKELVDIYDSARGAQAFVNILKANRPKENFAFEETEDGRFAIYRIPVEETGGANVTPPITDTSGVGTEDTGKPPEDTGTGIPPSSEGAGLGVSNTDATGVGIPKGVQSSTLMSLEDAQNELYDTEDRLSKDPNATDEDYEAAQAKYDAIEEAHIAEAESLGVANAQSALDAVDGPDYNGNLEVALDSMSQNLEDTLTEQGITDPLLVRRAREAFEEQADRIRDEREGAGAVKEKRNLLSYIGDLPQDKKRYDTYIQHPVHRHALDRVNEAIQQLTNFINKSGFEVNKVDSFTAKDKPEVQTARRLASQISGSAARLLSKLDAVDRGLQRANPEQVEQAKQQLGSDTLAAREFLEQQASTEENKPSANVGFVGSSYAYKDPIAALVDTLPLNQVGVNKLQRMLEDNKLSYAEYTNAMTYLQGRMRHVRDLKSATTSDLPKKRGFGRLMEALEDAVKEGKISPESYKMVRWFVSKNPEIAKDLAISIAQPKKAYKRNQVENGLLGEYSPNQRLVNIFLRFNPQDGLANYNNSDVGTAIHEILHHLERLMPKELQALLRNEWSVRVEETKLKAQRDLAKLKAAIKKQDGIVKNPARAKDHDKARAELDRLDKEVTKQENILKYVTLVNEYNANDNNDAADLAQKMITKGEVPYTMYALFDPSEFWAVTGSDIIAGRYGVSAQNKFKKIAQFLKEFIEYAKEVFGMPSDAPLLRGLKAILEGNGKYLSRQQLRTGNRAAFPNIKGWEQADTGVSDEELKAVETAMAAGGMHPTVVDAIANNDLAGALKAISQKVSGFYGELATRLAELNLPTGTRIGDQRNMTRRAIDLKSAEAQKTLFDFVRTMMPDVYAKYFENYDRPENLESVYKGLITIVNNAALKPVLPQYNTVVRAFKDAMKGLTAHGGYYPSFDLINLNPTTNQGLSYRVFLHETVHAATVMLLNTPADQRTTEQNEAIVELEKLFEAAKANTNIPFYGFTNLKEFISEIYTNKEFQAELRKIPYPPARTNMLSRFVKLVMDMFGMDNITGRAMIEANKLFNADRSAEPVSAGPVFSGAKGKGSGKPRVRGPISAVWRVVEDTMESVKDWDNVKKDLLPAMWDAGNGVFRNTMLGVMNLRQIADVTKTKFPHIASSIRIIEKMLAYRGKIMNEGGDIIQRWTKAQAKNTKVSQLLGRVMLEATIRGVEVDPKSSNYDSAKVNKEMADAWDALGPDFQQIYRDVRDFYRRAVDETIRLMKERANKNADLEKREQLLADIDAQFGPDKLKGPYFPLRRFGEFWFQVGQGNFKEFYTYESRLDRNRAMAARKRELSKGNAQQRGLAESIHSGNGVSELYSQNVANTQILQDVQKIIDSVGDTVIDKTTGVSRDKSNAEVKDELKDSLNQLIYILLPQQSMRKMFINRKAIQGASGDMLRVFATHAVHSAYQRSRFKYAQEFMDNLSNAHDWVKNFAKGKDYEVYRDYINEVEKRSKTILGTEDTSLAAKVAGKASEATFFFMLSSPFTAMLNTIGFAQVAMPYIGGKYGYAATNKRILENMGKYLKTAPTRTFSPLTKGHMSQVSFPSIVEGGQLEGILKDAAQQLLDEEQINISLTNDVFDIGSRPSATYTGTVNAVKRAVSGLFHQSERLNREITLLSVVELAYEKLMSEPIKDARGIVQRDAQGQPMRYTNNATTSDGKTQYSQEALQSAINEAKDIAGLALGDFTRQMKPRFFTPPLMSVLTKFKQYSVMASYAIIRNAHLGLIKPFSTKELDALRQELEEHYEGDLDKDQIVHQQMLEAQAQQKEVAKEARRRLAGILGMSYLFGGYAAMPFFSLLTPILVAMLAGDDDDDDEFFNWENWFKNYMEKEFGGYVGAMLQKFGVEETAANKAGRKVGETLMYGPGSTVTGGALSDRVSLDLKNLWYRDGRYSPDTRESVVENIIANAGPVVGLTVNAMEAWDMAQKGQVGRAFEKMAPALFSKPVTAARLATEGGKTKGGDTLVDEFTSAELAIQAVGLQPLRLSQAQKASIETVQKAQKITNKHDSIMNRLWMERDNGEAFNDALEDAIKFSEQHPGYAITAKKIKESFEKRAKDSAMAGVFGARIPNPLQGELMDMPDYGKE